MLIHQLRRVCRIPGIDEIVVATTTGEDAKPIIEAIRSVPQIGLFGGSEEDVLGRYYGAAREYHAEAIVGITSDCPLIDPEIAGKVIRVFQANPEWDYVSNGQKRTYPRGLDTEVFSFEALEVAH